MFGFNCFGQVFEFLKILRLGLPLDHHRLQNFRLEIAQHAGQCFNQLAAPAIRADDPGKFVWASEH